LKLVSASLARSGSASTREGSDMVATNAPGVLTREGMESLMRQYFDACNAADIDAIAACFTPEAVHYFPPGMYEGPFVGPHTIGARWRAAVETVGSVWTVDALVIDPDSARAVMEWTHFKSFHGTILRGDEWYEFDPASGLIREIRAYYASPQADGLKRLELGGFDYAGRGYPLQPPIERTQGV
jgi:SnoaL-like domain